MKIHPNNRYGRLLVISREVGVKPLSERGWLCLCDCGNEKVVSANCLRQGMTKSCGCLRKETTAARSIKHGKTRSPEWMVWVNMRGRCFDHKDKYFKDYGGRGITVCDIWKDDFSKFLEDMGHKPSKYHSIERVDNSRNYEPSNCVWSTPAVQANNRRSNILLDFNGLKLTVRQLMEYRTNGISYNTLRSRILEKKWDVYDAITLPLYSRI